MAAAHFSLPSGLRERGVLFALFLALTGLFFLTPWSGDDWETFYGAAQRLTNGEPLYGTRITHAYYSNPPWLAIALVPATLLPEKVGWAMLAAASLGAALAVLSRWEPQPGTLKLLLALINPAMMYIILHGQIDMIVVSGVLLSGVWWPLVAFTKPQVAIGLLSVVPRSQWIRAVGILVGMALVTCLLFGRWPLELLNQPTPFAEATHNLWLGLWPYQVPAGMALLVLGYQRRDARLAVAASPFLSPYAALSTLIGPWIALLTFLTRWQAVAVWLSWWGAVLFRAVVQ